MPAYGTPRCYHPSILYKAFVTDRIYTPRIESHCSRLYDRGLQSIPVLFIGTLHYVEKISVYESSALPLYNSRYISRALLTQWMAAAQLWLLRIFALKLLSDAVQQANIALLRILL